MTKNPTQTSPTPTNSKAEAELYSYVESRRESIPRPPEPKRLAFTVPEPDPERAARVEQRRRVHEEHRRRAELRDRAEALVRSAGSRYRKCQLSNFEITCEAQQRVVDGLREWIDKDLPVVRPTGLVLYGPVGTGKDHLAFAVCREAIAQGITVGWCYGQAWFSRIRDAMGTDKTEASLVGELVRPEVLCLSDPLPPISAGSNGVLSPHQTTMLYQMIADRYAQAKVTIVTVNVKNDDEARDRLGLPTWERMCDEAWKLHCYWPSYRQPARVI